ncbi:complex I NDUFA9 subunit family protein (plasmid) [Phyllobacterium sp. A18/5-2]|uniref:complex I NDUFA9 subunit family protein n=1 Tax=Phyllobacterium sp. A18/5-2 TaxID=2978392 RepID=UPI0021C5A925|nr:complex I NDUFA9 subunit family protein [Phyllobacterium sp. A18/5-2]UXN66478.1 complex I NDUFA9 subunit family protein [Phyllobacterium sp. A18/5-2]
MTSDNWTTNRLVTVFGATGFLGRRIVGRLVEKGFNVRAVSRHPERVSGLFPADARTLEAVRADILDPASVALAVAGSQTVVNAVSLYVERGNRTFERVHVKAAADLAAASRNSSVEQFIQISGIGSDAKSESRYIRARGQGEHVVASTMPSIIIRPSVMIGPDDSFLTVLIRLIRLLPVYPLFGNGETRLQPVYVGDVAQAISVLIDRNEPIGSSIFEFGGPQVYTYEELVREIAGQLGVQIRPISIPFEIWSVLARIAEFLPAAPLTRNQIELMRHDNVAARDLPGMKELDIEPHGIREVIRAIEQADRQARHG